MSEPHISRRAVKRMEGRRLAFYATRADAAYWSGYWRARADASFFCEARRGRLGWLEDAISRHFRPGGRVLEAGCGLGTYVVALLARGYRVEGLEWSEESVRMARQLCPDLPVRCGDAMQIDAPDGAYDAYMSIGVVEHRREGPDPFLREARRVLKDDGVALFAVPYLNALRRMKARLGAYRGATPVGREFYQYAYSAEEMTERLRAHGFAVVFRSTYGSWDAFQQEVPFLRPLARWPALDRAVATRLRAWDRVEGRLGHMILFVCRPAGAPGPAGDRGEHGVRGQGSGAGEPLAQSRQMEQSHETRFQVSGSGCQCVTVYP